MSASAGGPNQDAKTIPDLFQAANDDLLAVRFIPKNAVAATVLVTNKTNQFLDVQLPDAFAGVPVLAQFGQNFGGQNAGGQNGGVRGFDFGGQNNGGGNTQAVGGAFNGGGQGQGMQFGGGGAMRIPPGRTLKLKATTVCLEHGKREPNPRIAYKLIPIEGVTTDKRVASLCGQLSRGEVKQNTAQAVAWYLVNGLSWKQLAKVNRIESRYLGNVPMFTTRELNKARAVVAALAPLAPAKPPTPGTQEVALLSNHPGAIVPAGVGPGGVDVQCLCPVGLD